MGSANRPKRRHRFACLRGLNKHPITFLQLHNSQTIFRQQKPHSQRSRCSLRYVRKLSTHLNLIINKIFSVYIKLIYIFFSHTHRSTHYRCWALQLVQQQALQFHRKGRRGSVSEHNLCSDAEIEMPKLNG